MVVVVLVLVLVKERGRGKKRRNWRAALLGERGGPPLNVNVEKRQTLCQALAVHPYPTLQFFSWQKHSEPVTVLFAKHLTVDSKRCTVGVH